MQARARTSTERTGTRTEGRGGPTSQVRSHEWVHPHPSTRKGAVQRWDGLGDGHIVTHSSINLISLCLHNSECFSCFMEVDKSSTGDGEAEAGRRDACPAPALSL